jgi:hypothetical protein
LFIDLSWSIRFNDKPLGCQNIDPTDTGRTINMGITYFWRIGDLALARSATQLMTDFINLP